MLFETISTLYEVSVLFEGDNRPCMMTIRFVPGDVVTFEGTFPNARMLSAQLRDSLGLADAQDVVDRWCISPNSDLWDFNHSRPIVRLAPRVRNDNYLDDASRPDEGYNLLGETGWSNYDGGGDYYLYERMSDMTLWVGECSSPGGGCEAYDNVITPIRYSEWVALVVEHEQYARELSAG